MKKYNWLPSESAHELFPMQIIEGDLIYPDGSSIYIPDGKIINNGFGEVGSTHIVGDTLKPLPTELNITWFSFVEDTFYSGLFKFPEDTIIAAFNKGIKNPISGEHDTYNRIIVGMGLEGWLSVWLAGGGLVHEIAIFKGEEVDVEWSRVIDNPDITREFFIQHTLQQYLTHEQLTYLQESPPEAGLWERYIKPYDIDLRLLGTARPLDLWLQSFNGESLFFDLTKMQTIDIQKSLPQNLKLTWENDVGVKYLTDIELNEDETFRSILKLQGINPEQKVTIQIEISRNTKALSVSVKNDDYIIELEKLRKSALKLK